MNLNCAVFGHLQRHGFIGEEPAVHSHCAWCGNLYREPWWWRLKLWWLIQKGIREIASEVREQKRQEKKGAR